MLTTLPKVTARLGLDDTIDDAFLKGLIAAVSARFDQECQRRIQYIDNATFEFDADYMDIMPDVYPIRYVTGWGLKTNERFGFRPLNPQPEYIIKNSTVITLVTGPLGSREQRGQVTLSGGYVPPGQTVADGQVACPADLEQACIEQVVYWYQNRNRLGLPTVSAGGATITQNGDLDLLPMVVGMLRPYRRLNL